MKAQILKIAGVKSEKEFYKKYPTEEAFMKKHGHKLKKAAGGIEASKYLPVYDAQQAEADAAQQQEAPLTFAESIGKVRADQNRMAGEAQQLGVMPEIWKKNQLDIVRPTESQTKKEANEMLDSLAQKTGDMIGIGKDIYAKNKALNKQRAYTDISKLQLDAAKAASRGLGKPKNKYVRPEDQLLQPDQMGNPLGTGTNYLFAANGASIGGNLGEIQNIYNPGDIYSDLGYQPLNDSNKIKRFADGGQSDKYATLNKYSKAAGSLSNAAGGIGSLIGGGKFRTNTSSMAGSDIGEGVGGVATLLTGIPGLDKLGGFAGGLIGGWIGADQEKELEKAQTEMNTNAQLMAQQNFQANNAAYMREGGYMNPNYNPQLITMFGDHDVTDVHNAANVEMRAGGHLQHYTPPSAEAMYTGRDLPFQMENGGKMAMGGDLRVHRGKAETMSYNPYLPEGGETVMFRGPSHENGGMPISYGQNGVEVEGGEPATVLQNGGEAGEDGNLVVFGNMVIPGYGVDTIGDPKAKGKKFKHYVADLSKTEAKQNKILDKSTNLISDIDGDDPFDQLSMNAGHANVIGANMKLKDIADKKKKAAAVQNAILDVAEKHGLVSDELAKGKVKIDKQNSMYAEFGAKLTKAEAGKKVKYDPEFENFINQAMMLEQANSDTELKQADGRTLGGIYRGGASNYGTGKDSPYNTPEKAKEFYYKNYWSKVKDLPPGLRTRALQLAINTGDPYGELMVAAGKMSVADRAATKGQRKDKYITGNKDWEKNKADILKAYKEDPQAFLAKLDAEQDRYYDSIVANNDYGINKDTNREFFDDYVGLARNASQQYIPTKQVVATTPTKVAATAAPAAKPVVRSSAIGSPLEGAVTLSPIAETQPGAYIPNLSQQIAQARILEGINNPKEVDKGDYSEDVRVVLPKSTKFLPSGIVGEGDYVPEQQATSNQFGISDFYPIAQTSEVKLPTVSNNTNTTTKTKSTVNSPTNWGWSDKLATALNSAIPYLRPTNQMPLDPSQLQGEMLALQDQVKPVKAQLYNPQLTSPYSISLQDQLNEITSQSRAAQKMAGYDPAAAAQIAAGAANMKNRVLGEQFRMNQAERARSTEANRQALNDAQLKNLGILDQQYVRQEQAESNTKQQRMAALQSIAAKKAQNDLANRTLGTYENLYNYRFGPDGQAYNANPLARLNIPTVGYGASSVDQIGQGTSAKALRALADLQEEAEAKMAKESKTKKRNGSIVKAIKGL